MNCKLVAPVIFVILLTVGCIRNDIPGVEQLVSSGGRTFIVTATIPDASAKTRTSSSFGLETKDIIVKWKQGDKINLFFKQDYRIKEQRDVTLYDFSNGNKTARFDIAVPQDIDITQPYTLYGTHGAESKIAGDKIMASGMTRAGVFDSFDIPLWFKTEVPASGIVPPVSFQHLGALLVTQLENTSDENLNIFIIPLVYRKTDYALVGFREPEVSPVSLREEIPGFNLITQTVEDYAPFVSSQPFTTILDARETEAFAYWGIPRADNIPETVLGITVPKPGGQDATFFSTTSKPARDALQTGHAYHISAEWDGTELRFPGEVEPNRPRLPIEYVAEYNVSVTVGTFTDSHANNKSGYFDWDAAKTACPAGYHLPSQDEWRGILPNHLYGVYVNFQGIGKGVDNCVEEIVVGGQEKRTFTADYSCPVGAVGVAYALRFKDEENQYRSAWRYEYLDNPSAGGGKTMKITVRYLGPASTLSLSNITNDAFWAETDVEYITRTFPACGYIFSYGGNTSTLRVGEWGRYWSATDSDSMYAYAMAFDNEWAGSRFDTSKPAHFPSVASGIINQGQRIKTKYTLNSEHLINMNTRLFLFLILSLILAAGCT